MRFAPGPRYVLEPPDGTSVETVLRRYDPALRRRWGRRVLTGPVIVGRRRGLVTVAGKARVARGIGRHLGGRWVVPPPSPGELDEAVEDMLRVYVPGKLVPAELALILRPLLPGVAIRENPELGLFWFDDEDSELTVSAWPVEPGSPVPPVAGSQGFSQELMYECGVDDVHGPTPETAGHAWRIAQALQELGGIPVDRYGFRVERPDDLLPGHPTA